MVGPVPGERDRQRRVNIGRTAVCVPSTPLSTAGARGFHGHGTPRRGSRAVADVVLVLMTVGLFAVLAVVVRAVERL
jgi:hypothetical protein